MDKYIKVKKPVRWFGQAFFDYHSNVFKLKTERLSILEANESDAPFFMELMNSSNWLQFIGDRGIDNLEKAKDYIKESLLKSYVKNGFGLYKVLLEPDKKPIGICGFVKRDYLAYPDVGFAILPEFEGKGYITEAANATISYGFEVLKLSVILGITTDGNKASKKTLEKIGLSKVGKIREKEDSPELLLFSKKVRFKS